MTPWHPPVVHFAVALLPVACVLDVAALVLGRPAWHRTAYGLLVGGTAAAALAVLTGNAAATPFRDNQALSGLIERHENLGTWVLLVFLAVVLGRLPLELQGRCGGWPLRLWIAVAAAGAALLWWTGSLGGELVFRYGVGVEVAADPGLP